MTISDLEKQLPKAQFIRIHRSYLIALSFARQLEANHILMDSNQQLPVGKYYKQAVQEKFRDQ